MVVVDRSGWVADELVSTPEVMFERSDMSKREVCSTYGEDSGVFGILYIGSEIEHPDSVQLITNESSSIMIEETITNQLSDIVNRQKLQSYGIDYRILDSLSTRVGSIILHS